LPKQKKSAAEAELKQPNITDLIDVICAHRRERFPFERHIALITFSTWLHWPQNPRVVNQGKLIAAALVVDAIRKGSLGLSNDQKQSARHEIESKLLAPAAVANVLLNRAHVGSYREEFDIQLPEFDDVSGIVGFLLRCPVELKPSLNKARFFIDAEGYADEDSPNAKVSPATLKKSWVAFAIVSPFIFSAEYWNHRFLLNLAPDDAASISKASKFLRDAKRIDRFFGFALHVQRTIVNRLDPTTLRWLKFVNFPRAIKPYISKLYPLEPHQVEIVQKYRAPKQI
jgi:hypothetical protein